MSYADSLRDELDEHRRAGRDDRAAMVVAELKRLGEAPALERAVRAPAGKASADAVVERAVSRKA